MNYRHVLHAGNFADVFKHVVLVHLMRALQDKDSGFVYIDTHAGAGRYDLEAAGPQESAEYRDGIGLLWNSPVEGTHEYLTAVGTVNCSDVLRFYPGSPRIARFFLRPRDCMWLCERERDDCRRLRAEFAGDRQVQVRCGDGYAALKAWLPPPEQHGLVLIDPPFKGADEWEDAYAALMDAVDRWATGIHALWYPVKAGTPIAQFLARLKAAGLPRVLVVELRLWPDDTPFRLNGCGMAVVNPPCRLEGMLRQSLPTLAQKLKRGSEAPQVKIEWLLPGWQKLG
jgi:23S rRNA (adenine2030-N6)-methyltransferase